MMLRFLLGIRSMVEGKLAQDEIRAGLCHAVPDSLDALALACRATIHRDIRPAIRQSLEPFALRDGQAADGTGILRSLVLDEEIVSRERFLITHPLLCRSIRTEGSRAGSATRKFPPWIVDEGLDALVVACRQTGGKVALDNMVASAHSIRIGIDSVTIHGIEREGHIGVDAKVMPAVLNPTSDDVAGDAEGRRHGIAACFSSAVRSAGGSCLPVRFSALARIPLQARFDK